MQIPFLAQALTAQYGEAVAGQIERGMGERRITTLRANLLKTTPEDVACVLSAAGIAYTRWAANDAAFLLKEADERAVQALPLYERGEIYLQSLSSMLPPLALAPQEGADILDMAAAPGGKTALRNQSDPCGKAEIQSGKTGRDARKHHGARRAQAGGFFPI